MEYLIVFVLPLFKILAWNYQNLLLYMVLDGRELLQQVIEIYHQIFDNLNKKYSLMDLQMNI